MLQVENWEVQLKCTHCFKIVREKKTARAYVAFSQTVPVGVSKHKTLKIESEFLPCVLHTLLQTGRRSVKVYKISVIGKSKGKECGIHISSRALVPHEVDQENFLGNAKSKCSPHLFPVVNAIQLTKLKSI